MPNIIDTGKFLEQLRTSYRNMDASHPVVMFIDGLTGFLSGEFQNSVTSAVYESHSRIAGNFRSTLLRHDLCVVLGGITLAAVFYFWPVEEVAIRHECMLITHSLAMKDMDKQLAAKKAELDALSAAVAEKEAANKALSEKQDKIRSALGKISGGQNFIITDHGKWAMKITEYNSFWADEPTGLFYPATQKVHYVELPVSAKKN